jgi:hypothetical protein
MMDYFKRYFFNFYADRDTRIVDGSPDQFVCNILQLDYEGSASEIQAQQNPIQINYQNTSNNKLEPIIGSECTLNLIATEDFQLEDLYTENEREFLVEIYRKPSDINIYWSLDETPPGIDFVDLDLEIYVNGVREVAVFTDNNGNLAVKRGDVIEVKIYGAILPTSGIGGGNIEITGLPTQRTTTYPLSIDTTFTIEDDVYVNAYSTWSATEYLAIRSAVFYPACNNTEKIIFTKNYTSSTSQAAAQALADGDTGFNAEGQAYANANAVCYDYTDLIWTGFIIPDGCQESFTFAPYAISVNAVDGLGLLKNLSYVQNDGNFYLGKQSFIEVIEACLTRLDAPSLELNTCVNIYDVTMTQGNAFDPLAQAYVNAERYLKDDQFTPMNCEEVLRSILEEWTAVMVQSEGQWYIYRPTELAKTGNLVFRKYLEGQRVYDSPTFTANLDRLLGGESEGVIDAPFFHINTDQLKMIDKPYKNASMSYLYGKLENTDEKLANPTLFGAGQGCGGDPIGPCDDVTIPGYTKTGTMYAGLYPTGGVIFYSTGATYPDTSNYYQNNNLIPISLNLEFAERLRILIDYINPDPLFGTDMNFSISLTDGSITWYLQADGSWSDITVGPGINYYTIRSAEGSGGSVTILSNAVPASGNVTFRILAPSGTVHDIVYTRISGFVFIDFGDQRGEIHTATQRGKFTFVPQTTDVFNGDSLNFMYVGAIYGPNETTLTTLWNRRGLSESVLAEPYAVSKQFLRIAVEEKQRLYAGPYVQFEGSIFGYFNPVTRWSINLIAGYFMNISLVYDLQQNICKAVLGRIINDEIEMDYTLIPDFGETTKVTVKAT